MSLEQAITDHASALRELAAAIRSTIAGAHDIGTATDKVIAEAKKPAASASSASGAKPETTEKKAAAPAAKPEAKAKVEAEEEEQAEVSYEDVKAKILPLAQSKGRDTVVALLQRHGVSKAPDLKPAQWAAVIADIDAIEAGTYDPEASEELA